MIKTPFRLIVLMILLSNVAFCQVSHATLVSLPGSSALIAPTNVSAVWTGIGALTLSWNSSPGATSYTVYYRMNLNFNPPRACANGSWCSATTTSTSYAVSGLAPNDYFYVVATNASGVNSPASTTLYATQPCAAPLTLFGAACNGEVYLSWQGNSCAANYVVYGGTADNPTQFSYTTTGTSYVWSKLSNGKAYQFAVASLNPQGFPSTLSVPVTVTPSASPVMTLISPQSREIFQRDVKNNASIPVSGIASVNARYATANIQNDAGTTIATGSDYAGMSACTPFSFNVAPVPAQGGWYQANIALYSNGNNKAPVVSTMVPKVGVGEVFLVAGQSNSANFGEHAVTTNNDMISTMNPWVSQSWKQGDDLVNMLPYNGKTNIGSPWPSFASMLSNKLAVPVGVVSVGAGSTSVKNNWQPNNPPPGGQLFIDVLPTGTVSVDPSNNMFNLRLLPAAQELYVNGGMRAVLWHQGEADEGTTASAYTSSMENLIKSFRTSTNQNTPWITATAGYLPHGDVDLAQSSCALIGENSEQSLIDQVEQGQAQARFDGFALEGPNTDRMIGNDSVSNATYRYAWGAGGCGHFSVAGLQAHAQAWVQSVQRAFFPVFSFTHRADDFNGNGHSDILFSGPQAGMYDIWYMNGTNIASPQGNFNENSKWSYVGTGNFFGNASSDILYQNGQNLYIREGSTGQSLQVNASFVPGWRVVGIADFNGDGKSDILFYNSTTGEYDIWIMNGATYNGGGWIGTNAGWTLVGIGNFNGDKHTDLLFQRGANLEYWVMDNTKVTSVVPITSTIVNGWSVIGTADFDGDGRTDILFQNLVSGQLSIWYMNGGNVSSGNILSLTIPPGFNVVSVGDYDGYGKSAILLQDGVQIDEWKVNGSNVTLSAVSYKGEVAPASPGWNVELSY